MINKIIDIIQNPIKAAIATTTGAVTGSVPDFVGTVSNFDKAFQHSVWTITILVGMLSIISSIQKQLDRYRKRHEKH